MLEKRFLALELLGLTQRNSVFILINLHKGNYTGFLEFVK